MVGLFLILIASTFSEIGVSIGKIEVKKKKDSIYSMGFLSLFIGTVFFFLIALIKNSFVFSLASLPTFIPRVILEILLTFFTVSAIVKADRSTYSFIKVGTLPLLVIADLVLGYELQAYQIIGVGIIIFALAVLFLNHGINKKGIFYSALSAILAVATLSLFKYDITKYNSVEAEQGIISVILLIYLFFMARLITKENPLKLLKKKEFFAQSFFEGMGSVLVSFAFIFAPASIITTALRSFSVLAAMISGSIYFHERHFLIKLACFVFIAIGLVLLVV
ncbi:MAG: hypothetical protein A2430_00350 [Candidatus Liptonbacteria bacterium RIFOXYC1_FULL_36_8]|uniref:EamA domain-containing protein n=2 Tax=Candidatus Liptoniibacteriota TaxID=1817909 RepID=A0A1G2CMI2_9BACT|nr:MAG: hypothetical protein A2390_00545 [Candidatus Liptonbacteria bacterium RIFOXYB1_FULL_36_10]OGZ03275.1 MAG: hypothetical protein A2430_00350 [Candidatus Liptonbacteria bacterium RIFOXYC1_FULL_36_8]